MVNCSGDGPNAPRTGLFGVVKTLSQPLELAELHQGDHFYFAAQVFMKAMFSTIDEWVFYGPVRPGVFAVSPVEQEFGGEAFKAESAGEVRVLRIDE